MKDAIDRRNEKEKIQQSIVKRHNVNYITKEELERAEQEEIRRQQLEEERGKADEVLRRLEREAQEDENKKKTEIQQILIEMESNSHDTRGTYGITPMDGVTQERVEAILSDKERKIQQLIQDAEGGSENQKLAESVEEE